MDYRILNDATQANAYPLSYISRILDHIRGAQLLFSMDIKSARGLFQFVKMPFGLKNAPVIWQRLVNKIIGVDLEPFEFVYLDDIVYSIVAGSLDKSRR